MGLGKQAKTLSRGQTDAMMAYLASTRHAKRNRLIFLLSAKAGLRAKEIAKLTWRMTSVLALRPRSRKSAVCSTSP